MLKQNLLFQDCGYICIINETMYFHVVLARSLLCTLRSLK